jgi:XTP/dITP diphosphohydrolase
MSYPELERCIEVVKALRHPKTGCPWDLEQTQESLIPYIIEEAFETVDAIRSGNQQAIIEELGDLLLQVILQAQVARDENKFTLVEIANNISEKLRLKRRRDSAPFSVFS